MREPGILHILEPECNLVSVIVNPPIVPAEAVICPAALTLKFGVDKVDAATSPLTVKVPSSNCKKFSPDKCYFVLEGYPKHRISIDESYKVNRPKQRDEFNIQKASIISLLRDNFPIETVYHPDFECDDVIATLAVLHAKQGDECTVISSDTDFIQLFNLIDFNLYNPISKKFIPHPGYDYVTWKAQQY